MLIDFGIGCSYLQAAVLLFAMVGGGVLHTFYVEVSAVRPDAFADHLRTSECGASASDNSLAALVANMGMPVGVAFVIATAFANITASMNAAVATVITKARLGFHTGWSGMMNRRSNEGGGIR